MRFLTCFDLRHSLVCIARRYTRFNFATHCCVFHLRRAVFPTAGVVGFMLCAWPGFAVEPSTTLSGYSRQSWVMENGLPQNSVQALAQTRDGFLWIGTEGGLVRFDGTAFQVFDHSTKPALPGNDIRCLFETHDGALWIGTSDGPARWKDGAVTAYSTHDGLPSNGVRAFVETADGVLWVWTDLGLARLSGKGFVPDNDGIDGASVTAVLPIGPGGMMVEAPQQEVVYQNGHWSNAEITAGFPRGSLAFSTKPSSEAIYGSASTLVIRRGTDILARLSAGRELPGSRIDTLLADREGSVWIGTNDGLARWNGGQLQKLPVNDPLASASVLSLMEDREGNLWVGTENAGLHVLRDRRFRALGSRDGLSSNQITAVVEDAAGTIWVGTQRDGLNALHRSGHTADRDSSFDAGEASLIDAVKTYSVGDGMASDVVLSLAAAPNGDVWVGTPDGLSQLRGSRIVTFTSADGLPDDFIRSLLVDADGSLWIGTRRGLTHWTNASATVPSNLRMQTYTQATGLGSDLVGALARDEKGDLWVATLAGLSHIHAGAISNFTTKNGLSSNVVTSLLPRTDGTLLIGTQDHGWNVWDGQRFMAVSSGALDQTTVHAILDDERGHLWFATGNGIARCDSMAMRSANPAPSCPHLITFSTADGLPSRETATNSHPSAWRSRDGLLWFATPEGLVEVNPAHFPINTIPPPVAMERFAVDDVDQPLEGMNSSLKVAAGHVHFQFDYAGLSFLAPQKVQYRYMLDGFDSGWTEAGTRRSAYYTNVPPGRYTFRVQAANNDGDWNVDGASLSFELRRHWYQAMWFYALLLIVAAGIILLLIRLRLRRAEHEFRAVLGERIRIAREIHDTLAQGYVGISVQMEVLGELLKSGKVQEAEQRLALTREYVREGLADARQSIWALRTQDSSETSLPVRLRRVVEAAGGDGLDTRLSIHGAYRPLPMAMEQEFLRIAQEAVHNVKKHACASDLSVQLEYKTEEVALEICDNGLGGATDTTEESLADRFGLTGMRERAAAIGGVLEVSSERGEGTTVRLRAPVGREPTKGTR